MTREYVKVTIDGENSGIVAKIANDSKKPSYIIGKDKKPRLFNNLEVAKIMANTLVKDSDFEYFIKVGKVMVSINDCQRFNDSWQFFYDNKIYIVKEYRLRKTTSLGYICFEHGESERCDRKYGEDRQKKLMGIIRDISMSIFAENGEYAISKIRKLDKEYVLHVVGTTGKIHILYNSKLMDINQRKKVKGEKCLPFRKEMDKYLTFYIYSDKDVSESIKTNAEEKLKTIIDYIICDLQDYYKDLDPVYVSVEYSGYVELMEE